MNTNNMDIKQQNNNNSFYDKFIKPHETQTNLFCVLYNTKLLLGKPVEGKYSKKQYNVLYKRAYLFVMSLLRSYYYYRQDNVLQDYAERNLHLYLVIPSNRASDILKYSKPIYDVLHYYEISYTVLLDNQLDSFFDNIKNKKTKIKFDFVYLPQIKGAFDLNKRLLNYFDVNLEANKNRKDKKKNNIYYHFYDYSYETNFCLNDPFCQKCKLCHVFFDQHYKMELSRLKEDEELSYKPTYERYINRIKPQDYYNRFKDHNVDTNNKTTLIVNDYSFFPDAYKDTILHQDTLQGEYFLNTFNSITENRAHKSATFYLDKARLINTISATPKLFNLNTTYSINHGKNCGINVYFEVLKHKPKNILVFGPTSYKLFEKYIKKSFFDARGKSLLVKFFNTEFMLFPTISLNTIIKNRNFETVFNVDLFNFLVSSGMLFNTDYKKYFENLDKKYKNFDEKIIVRIRNLKQLSEHLSELTVFSEPFVALDIETNGLKGYSTDKHKNTITMFSITKVDPKTKQLKTYVIGYEHKDIMNQMDEKSFKLYKNNVRKLILNYLNSENIIKIFHNGTFDVSYIMNKLNISPNEIKVTRYFDTINILYLRMEEKLKGWQKLDNLAMLRSKLRTYYFYMHDYVDTLKNKLSELNSLINKFRKYDLTESQISCFLNINKTLINYYYIYRTKLDIENKNSLNDFLKYMITVFSANNYDDYYSLLGKNLDVLNHLRESGLDEVTIAKLLITTTFLNIDLLELDNYKDNLSVLYKNLINYINNFYNIDPELLNTFIPKRNLNSIIELINVYKEKNKIDTQNTTNIITLSNFHQNNFKYITFSFNDTLNEKVGYKSQMVHLFKDLFDLVSTKNNIVKIDEFDYSYINFDEQSFYAAGDTYATYEAFKLDYMNFLKRDSKSILKEYPIPLVLLNDILLPISVIQSQGIKIEPDDYEFMKINFKRSLEELLKNIYNHPDLKPYIEEFEAKYKEKFNIQSAEHLTHMFYDYLQVPDKYKTFTDKGNIQMNESAIKKIKGIDIEDESIQDKKKVEIAKYLAEKTLEYRTFSKLYSAYIQSYNKNDLIDTNYIVHPNYFTTGTVTGRMSSSEPNFQNIPKGDLPKEFQVKNIFVSRYLNSNKYFEDNDYKKPITGILLQADYSQMELRVLAMVSQDENLKNAFISGEDIHLATAKSITGMDYLSKDVDENTEITPEVKNLITKYKQYWGKEAENLTDKEILSKIAHDTEVIRKKAKTVNFGIVYGMTAAGLAERINVSLKEAEKFIEQYLNALPGVQNYIITKQTKAKEKGYVETIWNRKRNLLNAKVYLHDIEQIIKHYKDKLYSKNTPEEDKLFYNNIIYGLKQMYYVGTKSLRQSINAPIQGGASDFTFVSLICLNHAFLTLKELNIPVYNKETNQIEYIRPVLIGTVHDSIVIDIPVHTKHYIVHKVIKLVKTIMEDPLNYFINIFLPDVYKVAPDVNLTELKKELNSIRDLYLQVPLKSDVEVGYRWGILHEVKDVDVDTYDKLINVIGEYKSLKEIVESSKQENKEENKSILDEIEFTEEELDSNSSLDNNDFIQNKESSDQDEIVIDQFTL
ncbi:DNA polymerase [Deferribacter desulfuricans]|nr:DNA polymerase [Deferribacter desulfuricans]